MADWSDGQPLISEVTLCEIAGVNRATRRNWVQRGLLPKKDEYDEDDAVRVVVLDRLAQLLGLRDASIAWHQIGDDLFDVSETGELDVVFDTQHKEARLTTRLADIGPGLRHGRPVRVIHLGAAIGDIRAAFQRVTILS